VSDQRQLRQLLSTYFSESELKTLVFDLGVDYEMLPGQTKGDKALELIAQFSRSGRIHELIQIASQMRPNVEWPAPPIQSTVPRVPMPALSSDRRQNSEKSNPFTYGNPITDPSRFFGRVREVEQIFNRLRNSEGESSSIVGGRRIGKSSLLNYLANPDVRRPYGMFPADTIFVYIDLQMVEKQTTPVRLWRYMLTRMAHECQDDELMLKVRQIIENDLFDNFTLADLFDAIDRAAKQVVFLLDEFENVTSNPNFDPGFFYGLRSLAIQHGLSLVTSSQFELIELTHSQAIRSSPFFNIFANINMKPFGEHDSSRLIAISLEGTGVEFTEEELTTLAEITGGHPFFLQAAGHFLFEAHKNYAHAAKRRSAWLKAYTTEVEPHLSHFWRTTDKYGQRTLLLLALLTQETTGQPYFPPAVLEQFYPLAGQSINSLARLGYVTENAGQYALISTVFGDWIVSEIRTGAAGRSRGSGEEAETGDFVKLSPTRKRALNPILKMSSPIYHQILIGLVDQSNDPDHTISFLISALDRRGG
jgi:hypothetical protein